jgi:hypothetical protein
MAILCRFLVLVSSSAAACGASAPPPEPSSANTSIEIPASTAEPDAGVPPAPATDAGSVDELENELNWVRARFASLASLKDGSDVSEMVQWVDKDASVELWLTADKYRCAPVTARRTGDDQLGIAIVDSEKRVKGRRVRTLVNGYAGAYLSFGSSGDTAEEQPDGRWTRNAGWGSSGGTLAGAFSSIDSQRARYDGRAVLLTVSCPRVPLACETGGTRNCEDCDNFLIDHFVLESMHGGYGRVGPSLPRATCHDPCPAVDPSAADRARALVKRLERPWILVDGVASQGLYRSLAACKADLGSRP